jgi:hypothetical protein
VLVADAPTDVALGPDEVLSAASGEATGHATMVRATTRPAPAPVC